MRETWAVKERYSTDVYELFERSDTELMGEGRALLGAVSVVAFNKAETSRAYAVAATLHFAFPSNAAADAGKEASNKKRSSPSPEENHLVQLEYRYEESTVGERRRGKRVPVLEKPCKEVSLHIAASCGRAGLDRCVLVEFKMFTAGISPAEVKYAIPEEMIGESDDDDGDDDGGDDDDDGEDSNNDDNHGGDGNGVDDGDGDDEYDTADYYSVHVDRDALATAARWLQAASGFTDSALAPTVSQRKVKAQRRDENAAGGDGEGDDAEAKAQNMLMFVLSAPYVDEAWGVHDLVLDSCFPRRDDDDDDGDDVDVLCCRRPTVRPGTRGKRYAYVTTFNVNSTMVTDSISFVI